MKQRKFSRSLSVISALASSVLAWSCSDEATVIRADGATGPELGSLNLALTVSGFAIDSVDVSIASEDLDPPVVRNRTIDVADANAAVSATEQGLQAGTYSISLAGNLLDDPATTENESQLECEGSVGGVSVQAGQATVVEDLVLNCQYQGGGVGQGGITFQAQVNVDSTPPCGDLVQELSIASLQTSVGGSVALVAIAEPGVAVAWSAEAGEVSADGSTYTCPAVAGQYEVTASFSDGTGCQRSYSEVVTCKSTFEGECSALPEAFVFEGSCGLRSPCHLVQDGCSWEAECRGRTIRGEGDSAATFSFIDTATTGLTCSTELIDGELVGSCTDAAGASCSVNTNTQPGPVPQCEKLEGTISDLTVCGQTHSACEVIHDRCSYQAKCEDGTTFTGAVQGNTLRVDTTIDGNSFRCEEPIVDGQVSGSCAQRGRGIENPIVCNDFSATAPVASFGSCEETLPSAGFKLEGCGLDNICFGQQRGCVWEIVCGGTTTYSAIASESNVFEFSNAEGDACVANVVNGRVQGSCSTSAGACEFAEVPPTVDESCFQIPSVIESSGCGGNQLCQVFQDGCEWAASCNAGTIAGTADAISITWPGFNPDFICTAEVTASGAQMNGGCTRENADGTVSQCRDLTNVQDDFLVLTFPQQ